MNTDVSRDVNRDVACPEVCVLTETRGRETHTDSRDTCRGHAHSDLHTSSGGTHGKSDRDSVFLG